MLTFWTSVSLSGFGYSACWMVFLFIGGNDSHFSSLLISRNVHAVQYACYWIQRYPLSSLRSLTLTGKGVSCSTGGNVKRGSFPLKTFKNYLTLILLCWHVTQYLMQLFNLKVTTSKQCYGTLTCNSENGASFIPMRRLFLGKQITISCKKVL